MDFSVGTYGLVIIKMLIKIDFPCISFKILRNTVKYMMLIDLKEDVYSASNGLMEKSVNASKLD